MSFAPHTNDRRTIGTDPVILGQFREFDTDNTFEFGLRENSEYENGIFADFPHVIYCGAGGARYARVLQTVAYIVIDEDADGEPVVQKWKLRGHREYDLTGVTWKDLTWA